MKVSKQLFIASLEYYKRKNRINHPDGKFGNAQRWLPSDSERQDCCAGIRSPSRAYPLSYNTHCRTITHVASLYKVDEKELRRYSKHIEPVFNSLFQATNGTAGFKILEESIKRECTIDDNYIKGCMVEHLI